MIELISLTKSQKRVVGQQSKSCGSFSPKTENVSLTLCQSSEHLQGTLLTILLDQFIKVLKYMILSFLKD